MYPQYAKIKKFLEKSRLLDNTNKTFKDIYQLSIIDNKKAVCCQFYNESGKLKQYKYSKFNKNVRIASYNLLDLLDKEGIGRPIVLKMRNNPHWGEMFWAILACGYTPLLIDARTSRKGTMNLIKQSNAFAIITDDENDFGIDKFMLVDLLENNGELDILNNVWNDEVILCSSGTTGDIKLMVFSGFNFVNQIQSALFLADETKDLMYPNTFGKIKILAMIPFHHIFGFVAVFLWFTFYGKTIIYPSSLAPSDILNVCQRVGITHVFSVPLFWDSMTQTLNRKADLMSPKKAKLIKDMIAFNNHEIDKKTAGKAALSLVRKTVQKKVLGCKVRYCISGGGYLNELTNKTINGVGYPLYNGYGMTELGVTSVSLSNDVKERLKGNIGHPLHGIQYKIVSEDPKKPNHGQLFVKSNIIHQREIIGGVEQTTSLDSDGYFATGDIAEMDENGNYYIKGRIKDVIINADGENIFPDELELFFKDIPHVSNLTIFGLKEGNSTNEKIVLVIETDMSCKDEDLEHIKEELNDRKTSLPKNGKIDEIYISKNKLPIANSMKVKRFEVKKSIQNNDPNYVSINQKEEKKQIIGFTDNEIDQIREPLRAIFAEVLYLQKGNIKNDSHWINDLGGDSMSYVELLQKSESHFDVKLDENLYGKLATLDDFSEAFLKALKEK